MKEIFLGLGGNIGDVRHTLYLAERAIRSLPFVHDLKRSRIYQTSPVSTIPQPHYLNCVLSFRSDTSAHEILQECQMIEKLLGKKKGERNGPRVLDIDILLYGDEYINDEQLQIPHPRFHKRLFVLIPLLDLTQKVSFQTPDSTGVTTFDVEAAIRSLEVDTQDTIELMEDSVFS